MKKLTHKGKVCNGGDFILLNTHKVFKTTEPYPLLIAHTNHLHLKQTLEY